MVCPKVIYRLLVLIPERGMQKVEQASKSMSMKKDQKGREKSDKMTDTSVNYR